MFLSVSAERDLPFSVAYNIVENPIVSPAWFLKTFKLILLYQAVLVIGNSSLI